MIVHGTFTRATESPAPFDGPGSIRVGPEGIELRGSAQRTTFILLASIALSLAMAVVGVVVALRVLGALGLTSDWHSFRSAAGAGGVALLVTFTLARRLLPCIAARRDLQVVVPYRYVVSGAADEGALHLALSAPDCTGRVTLQTSEGDALLAEIRRQSP